MYVPRNLNQLILSGLSSFLDFSMKMYEVIDMGIIKLYNWERWCYNHHLEIISKVIKAGIRIMFGGVIPYQAQIGEGTFITYHGLGVVIHKNAVVGKNCIIRQNVTIAGGNGGVPQIGDGVEINAGAVLLGPIHIGNNVRIGANAVVNTDIPDNCTAVGMPAKPVRYHDPITFKLHV